jgi:probable rRNA maturation factor
MLEVEVFGTELLPEPLPLAQVEHLCALAMASAGIEDGHLAVQFVTSGRIAELNEQHRGNPGPTDVLSFPIDGADPAATAAGAPGGASPTSAEPCAGAGSGMDAEDRWGPPRELGDIVICPEHTADLNEAIVHGALHLIGMDHETDSGQMLALQAELLRWGAT